MRWPCGGATLGDGFNVGYHCEFFEGEVNEPDGEFLECEFVSRLRVVFGSVQLLIAPFPETFELDFD